MESLIIKNQSGDFEVVPAGLYNAVCISVAYLGNIQTKFGPKPKVSLVFELEDGGVITTEQSPSLHPQANLRKLLVSWRGRDFTKEEADGFELMSVLGASCQINVIHTEKDGKVYANIDTIIKKAKVLKPTVKPFGFSVEDPDAENFDLLPRWVQNRARQSDDIPAGSPLSANQTQSDAPVYKAQDPAPIKKVEETLDF